MAAQTGSKFLLAVPLPARVLGGAGLLPFVIGALAMRFAPEIKPDVAQALLIYGAVTLSFVGGMRWGFAVLEDKGERWGGYGLSVAPALVAWLGAAGGGPGGLLVLAVGLGLWFAAERASPPSLALPGWYFPYRGALTLIAAASLAAAAFYW